MTGRQTKGMRARQAAMDTLGEVAPHFEQSKQYPRVWYHSSKKVRFVFKQNKVRKEMRFSGRWVRLWSEYYSKVTKGELELRARITDKQ